MTKKYIGNYPLTIRISVGGLDLGSIDIKVPTYINPHTPLYYDRDLINGYETVDLHGSLPRDFRKKVRETFIEAMKALEESLNEETEVIAHEKSSMA
ncbi:hypothetical protein [Bifidobacterium moukalabense]|uniref:Uncharacterized protein n=2 Tax=Bifidobacterium moukalabense TaxID=1333651 RepID=W4NAL9_9BIFI|nr:hypothetical protein [Bifidobacterium moukalabense]ETY71710.1 hypothetical protein BMOU_0790 [Bifidobacterium moukalabense DSM 27321]